MFIIEEKLTTLIRHSRENQSEIQSIATGASYGNILFQGIAAKPRGGGR